MTPGKIIKLRERLGLNISEFANEIGVKRSTIYRWESGDNVPRGAALRALERLDAETPKRRSSLTEPKK